MILHYYIMKFRHAFLASNSTLKLDKKPTNDGKNDVLDSDLVSKMRHRINHHFVILIIWQ